MIVDDRLFDRAESTGSGPSRVSPILVNDNMVDVIATPASKVGEPAAVKLLPETSFVSFDGSIETVAEGEKPSITIRSVGPRRFALRGKLPVGHKPVVKVYEVEEPAAFARTLFIERLRKHGLRWRQRRSARTSASTWCRARRSRSSPKWRSISRRLFENTSA